MARDPLDRVCSDAGKRDDGGEQMAKLIARVDPTLEDYIEAAALAEGVPIDEYAGALLQVGWDAVFGFRKSDRFPRAASAARQAELRARFVELRASLHQPAETASDLRTSPRLVEGDDSAVPRHDQLNLDVPREQTSR